MKTIVTILLLSCATIYTSIAQTNNLDIEGNSKIVGLLDLRAHPDDSLSVVIGKNAGINTDFSTQGIRYNTFIGAAAGKYNNLGTYNTFIGFAAGLNSSGANNTAIGRAAGTSITTGWRNTFIGSHADQSTFGVKIDKSIAIGYNATVDCSNCAVIGGVGDDAVKVGIGTGNPQSELDVRGHATVEKTITIGSSNDSLPVPGTIRWNPETEDFEGYDGTSWLSLTGKVPPIPTDTSLVFIQSSDSTIRLGKFSLDTNTFISGDSWYNYGPILHAGRASVWEYSDSNWTLFNAINCPNPIDNDEFGHDVSISGDYAIVGSPYKEYDYLNDVGLAYLYHREDSVWIEDYEFSPGAYAAEDYFGYSVAISGDYVIVGAPGVGHFGPDSDHGEATIFYPLPNWSSGSDVLRASDATAFDGFGQNVDIAGNYAIIAAKEKVYVFHRTGPGNNWTEQAILSASDGMNGDKFGASIKIAGDYVIVGAPYHDTGGHDDKGKAYIFYRSGSSWSEQAQLTASDGAAEDKFGTSVSIYGNYAVVGAPFHDADVNNDNNQGQAYLFERADITWTEKTILGSLEGEAGDHFGYLIDISSEFVLIGGGGGIYSYLIE